MLSDHLHKVASYTFTRGCQTIYTRLHHTRLHEVVRPFTRGCQTIYTRLWDHLHEVVKPFTRGCQTIYTRLSDHLHEVVRPFTRGCQTIYTRLSDHLHEVVRPFTLGCQTIYTRLSDHLHEVASDTFAWGFIGPYYTSVHQTHITRGRRTQTSALCGLMVARMCLQMVQCRQVVRRPGIGPAPILFIKLFTPCRDMHTDIHRYDRFNSCYGRMSHRTQNYMSMQNNTSFNIVSLWY